MTRKVKLRRLFADLAPATFADQVEAHLGRPVSLLIEEAPDGAAVVEVHPADGGDPVVLADDVLVGLADRNAPPVEQPDPLDALESALADAKTVADLRAALSSYAAGEKKRRPPKVVRPVRPLLKEKK